MSVPGEPGRAEGEAVSVSVRTTIAMALAMGAVGAASPPDLAALEKVEHERVRALVDADIETARKLHADDYQLINPMGGVITREQYLGAIASGDLDYLSWTPGQMAVRHFGSGAVVRYQAEIQVVVKGVPDAPVGKLWHTDVYELRDGRWQVVWSQATHIR